MATDSTTTAANGHTTQWDTSRPITLTSAGVLSTPDGEVRPNLGRTVADTDAIGPDSEPLAAWQSRHNISPANQIRLVKLAHMRYQHPDLPTIERFMRDFGMHVAARSADGERIWFRGYGEDPYVYYAQKGPKEFLGGTFLVESMADLEKAAALPEATGPIVELEDAPGGGFFLALRDPEGFPVNLMYGQQPAEKGELPQKVILNDETDKPRVRQFNRFTPGPAAVHKLGHYGLCVRNFQQQLEWYTRTFNLAPTDFLYVPTPDGKDGKGGRKDVAVFAHIDRGEQAVDHHTFFMSTNPTSHVHHCSFEVHDYDTQHLGHQWLAKQGYTPVWGIGRHILGSQYVSILLPLALYFPCTISP